MKARPSNEDGTQDAKTSFASDWKELLSGAREWTLKIVKEPYQTWKSRDWHRLADLYSISSITDVLEFDSLHEALRSHDCVPDRKTLLRIGDWKTPRAKRWLGENEDADIASTTKRAFQIVMREKTLEASNHAMELLWDDDEGLYGLGVPMASTLLTMFDPVNFGVIDTYAWYCLFDEKDIQTSSVAHWERYLPLIQRIAQERGMRCRDADASLWYAGQIRYSLSELSPPRNRA